MQPLNGGGVIIQIEGIGPYGFRSIIADFCGNKMALYSKAN